MFRSTGKQFVRLNLKTRNLERNINTLEFNVQSALVCASVYSVPDRRKLSNPRATPVDFHSSQMSSFDNSRAEKPSLTETVRF